ncbi:IclR family transcriptional regulator domain-containing protein [Actinomadura macrotermitis]|uniref:IclR family transcriptional regulator n=1 Tax=Actinomadura macrotermitis TaxID=2585200 RepID=A0A7K0C3P1_9ACTN|nr:IclR family transcriptional regulator C-terminal domain-containing protein [Actinomadura macrotermitis]MQY07712.1 hypothetical protein [Actinomadura macrotermitis]
MGQVTADSGPLERGLEVLEALGRAPAGLRPADLVKTTGLVRSTVDRIVATLVRIGYLRWQGREVAATPRLMELGNAYLAGGGVAGPLAPLAARLADALEESVSLAVPDGDGVRFVGQSPRRRTMSVAFRIGDLLPAERSAPGAIFAAGWDAARWERWERRVTGGTDRVFSVPPSQDPGVLGRFRERVRAFEETGRSVDDQLVEPGLVAVAVPVRDAAGAVACALSVVSHTSRHSAASLREHAGPALAECVARMQEALAAPPAAPEPAPGLDRSRDLKRELGPGFLQSLDRGLAVLAALGGRPGGMTISEVAAATGQPRATARRSLLTLCELGHAAAAGRRFVPLPRVLDLGYAALGGLSFEDVARPHLRDLVERVHDSASLAVLDGTDIRYVARVATSRIMRVAIHVGTRFPAYATSMGRVLLAGLPEDRAAGLIARSDRRPLTARTRTDPAELAGLVADARRDGFALVDQELEEGLRSLAVPVRDRAGRVVAALNAAGHAGTEPAGRTCERLLPALREAAAAIEADLAVLGAYQELPGVSRP